MDTLSNDILHLIVAELVKLYLPGELRPKLAAYSTISRPWQYEIESRTMAEISLPHDSKHMAEFTSIFSQVRRRASLRSLFYHIRLPTNSLTDAETDQNVAVLRDAVSVLWHQLYEWDRGTPDNELPPLLLLIYYQNHTGGGTRHNRHLELSQADLAKLPLVRRISRLRECCMVNGPAQPAVLPQLAYFLPRIEEIDLDFIELEHKQRNARKHGRDTLAKGILGFREALPRLRKLRIDRESPFDPENHSFQCQDLENDGIDPLCEAIRLVAQAGTLESLQLDHILVSQDLFRNRRLPLGEEDTAVWPSLQRFSISSGAVAPNGEWYYTGDEQSADWDAQMSFDVDKDYFSDFDSDDSDLWSEDGRAKHPHTDKIPMHTWRVDLDSKMVDPLLLDMASAVLRMPKLQTGYFQISNRSCNHETYLSCTEVGQRDPYCGRDEPDDLNVRRWKISSYCRRTQWEPSDLLMAKMSEWVGSSIIKRDKLRTS